MVQENPRAYKVKQMNILVIGSGAREHILIQALKKADVKIFNIGTHINPGIKKLAEEIALISCKDLKAIQAYAQKHAINFTWIGPEAPLAEGVADALWQIDIPVIGPKKALAQLETSKGFTRQLQKKYQLPGAVNFKYFDNIEGAAAYLENLGAEYVVKADGLMGGKGVKLSGEHLTSHTAALNYCQEILNAGQGFVLEEKLVGSEFSLLCFCDGKTLVPMPILHDHKRAFNNDQGPNTGGMGVYTDANGLLPFVSQEDVAAALMISEATIKALAIEVNDTYIGIVYGSFMATRQGVKVIEFNARFGDPEVINLLSLLETDLLKISLAMLKQQLASINIQFKKQASVCKYIVPEGYPDHPLKDEYIDLGTLPSEASYFYASITEDVHGLKLLGSRALAVVALAANIPEASAHVENVLTHIKGPVFHRSDIGTKALINERIKHMNTVTQRNLAYL
jgi:phosphoribosylamine--glycine ligase